MKHTILTALSALAFLSGAAHASIATVGVYDENTLNSNTVDAVAAGSSLTLAETTTRVADAFANNLGGVWNFDAPLPGASSYELFYGVDQTETLTLGITSNNLATAVVGVTGGTSIPISGAGIGAQGTAGARTYSVSKPLTMIAMTSLQRTDKNNPSLSLTATLQDNTTLSTTLTSPSASTPQILHVLTATNENPIVSFSTNSSSFARIDDLAFEVVAPGIDETDPVISSLAPSNGATNFPINANLVATFSENITLGSGDITIRNLDTLSDTVITLPDARVSVSGAVLTINPSVNLVANANYAIRIAPTAITDIAGNPFAGISDDTSWNFVTTTVPLRIMCMGDSITAGYTDNPGWVNHPFEFGYRSGLYTLLTNAGYNFLLVGGSTEPWTGISGDPSQGGTYTPPLDLRTLGQDGHRGYGSQSVTHLNNNILAWLANDNPDIILLKIGTNSQNQSGLNTLVNTITTTKPDCHLIIAQIMPKYTYDSAIANYNTYIRDTLVPNHQALGRKVSMVDQYAPFLTNPADLTTIDQTLFSNGINHPDNDGYDKMAQVWFDGIETLGIGPNNFTGWIANPAFGITPGQQGFDQDPDSDGIKNGIENYFGTHPGQSSQGLVASTPDTGANTFTFSHPLNPTPAADLTATYRWSKDLSTFTDDGNAFEGSTVTFSRSAPTAGVVTVTATVTGTPIDKLFVDIKVQQN